jgi:hypothetical protein
MMFGDGFEQSRILRTGPDGLTRVITHSSWGARKSEPVEPYEARAVCARPLGRVRFRGARIPTELGGV